MNTTHLLKQQAGTDAGHINLKAELIFLSTNYLLALISKYKNNEACRILDRSLNSFSPGCATFFWPFLKSLKLK